MQSGEFPRASSRVSHPHIKRGNRSVEGGRGRVIIQLPSLHRAPGSDRLRVPALWSRPALTRIRGWRLGTRQSGISSSTGAGGTVCQGRRDSWRGVICESQGLSSALRTSADRWRLTQVLPLPRHAAGPPGDLYPAMVALARGARLRLPPAVRHHSGDVDCLRSGVPLPAGIRPVDGEGAA